MFDSEVNILHKTNAALQERLAELIKTQTQKQYKNTPKPQTGKTISSIEISSLDDSMSCIKTKGI